MKIKVIHKSGFFTVGDYQFTPDCVRSAQYNEINSHYDSGVSDKYLFIEFKEVPAKEKTTAQLIAEIDNDLIKLDATPRMLSGALMGDQWSIDKIKNLELEQSALRDKRKALL